MVILEDAYKALRDNAHKDYSTFKSATSPALKCIVYFTAEGFNHILYKNKNRARNVNDQYMRLKVIDLARDIIAISTTYQEYDEILQDVVVEIKRKKRRVTKLVKYWGFIAIIKNKKLRVIVKQIGEGKHIFWSVQPFWKTTKHDTAFYRDFAFSNMSLE